MYYHTLLRDVGWLIRFLHIVTHEFLQEQQQQQHQYLFDKRRKGCCLFCWAQHQWMTESHRSTTKTIPLSWSSRQLEWSVLQTRNSPVSEKRHDTLYLIKSVITHKKPKNYCQMYNLQVTYCSYTLPILNPLLFLALTFHNLEWTSTDNRHSPSPRIDTFF